jgi:hypothetical protein
MKKILLSLVVLWACTARGYAGSFTLNGISYNETSATEVEVIANNPAYSGAVTIPATVVYNGKTYDVRGIGTSAFKNCTGLTSVVIPNSVTTIGYTSFESCTALTSLNLGEGVMRIDQYAFNSCTALKTLIIPNSVVTIRYSAFQSCTSLITLTLGNQLQTIEYEAFKNCTSLTSVTIPASVTGIGTYAFGDCNKLTTINVDAANATFSSDNGVLFNKAKTILAQCPAGKTGAYSIPEGVAYIYPQAFKACSGLTNLTIPKTTVNILANAFDFCGGLTQLHCKAAAPPTILAATFDYVNKNTCVLYVPAGSINAYKNHQYWGAFFQIAAEPGDGIDSNSGSDPVVLTQYYTLSGKPVQQPQEGNLYVVKELRQSGNKTVRKELKRAN